MDVSQFRPDVDRWVALRTSARWEKKVAATLAGCDVPVFLPLIRSVSRARSCEVPLFTGYLFCSESHLLGNPRVPAACRKQIAQLLRPPDFARLKTELAGIADFLKDHQLVQERLYGSPGDPVRIVAGPLTGSDAIIVGLDPKRARLLLEVSFLGVRVEVELAEHLVQKT